MGIFKTTAKIAGTILLTTTGVSSKLLGAVIDMAGGDSTATPLSKIQEGSFDIIKRMWEKGDCEDDYGEDDGKREIKRLQERISAKNSGAMMAWNTYQKLSSRGDEEKAQIWREKFEELMAQEKELQDELKDFEREL